MEKFKEIILHPLSLSIIIIAIGVGGIIGLIQLGGSDKGPSAEYVERSWGKQDSKVVITEYSDFQCPACGSFYSTEQKLKANYEDKIKFVYKHYPLGSIHPNAQRAAEAAEAAGAQGKFWEFHDLLFSRQQLDSDNWTNAKLTEYASQLGLDTERFKKELEDDIYAKAVRTTREEAVNAGYTSTPTVLINGQKIENTSYEIIEAEIKELLGIATPTPTTAPSSSQTPTATPRPTEE